MPKKQPPKDEPLPRYTHAMMAEECFTPTLEGLTLVESIRAEDPPIGEEDDDLLVEWIHNYQPVYLSFLGKILAGSSYKAAALSLSLPMRRLNQWLKQGACDMEDNLDTYSARLLRDCQRAGSMACEDAEQRVHRQDPSKWLARGPGRDFFQGKHWNEAPRLTRDEPDEAPENPLDPSPVRAIEHQVDDSATDGDPALAEALKVLDTHRILKSPEFVEQAKKQYKLDGQG